MTEQPDARVDEYVERARSYYTMPGSQQADALPYHNWGHAMDVYWQADELARLSERKVGAQVNRQLLLISAAWHDANYHIPLGKDFESKEYRSAALAQRALPELSEDDRHSIALAIIDTTVERCPKASHLGIALHFADIGYMAAENYEVFLASLTKMREEWGLLSWDETIRRTTTFADNLVSEARTELTQILMQEDVDAWVSRVESNIAKLRTGTGL